MHRISNFVEVFGYVLVNNHLVTHKEKFHVLFHHAICMTYDAAVS